MSEQPGSLAAALVALQTRLPRITKDATAQYGKYADLHAITAIVVPILAELGLYWYCAPTLREGDGEFVLAYRLCHVNGERIEGHYPLAKNTPQTMGSQITYARRYALCAVLGIAPAEDDDDAQAAEQASKGSDWQAPANPTSRKAVRSRNTADEHTPWNDERAEEVPGSITDKQLQTIGILFGKIGVRDRGDRLALVIKYLDLAELASSKDLSMGQGSRLIARLQKETAELWMRSVRSAGSGGTPETPASPAGGEPTNGPAPRKARVSTAPRWRNWKVHDGVQAGPGDRS